MATDFVNVWAAVHLVAHFALCAAVLAAAAWVWTRPAPLASRAAAVVAAACLVTPYAYIYGGVMLVAAAGFLLQDGLARGFLSWEKPLLCLGWALPSLFPLLGSPTAPLACQLLLLLAARRAGIVSRGARSSSGSQPETAIGTVA